MTLGSLRTRAMGSHFPRAAWLATLLCASVPLSSARAFSTKEKFDESPGKGGGGGRYFTGSPVDGYACTVCHQGGPEPKIRIIGLPIDGYVPGQTYPIEVNWDYLPNFKHSLHLEFIGRDGRGAGVVSLLQQTAVDALGRCDSTAGSRIAAYDAAPSGRKILGVEDCGASNLRFLFTPPNTADLAFAISVVASNHDASPSGDGAFAFQRVLRRVGEPKRTGDCSISSRRAQPTYAVLLAALALMLRTLKRRRR